jgi:hypothetical protein
MVDALFLVLRIDDVCEFGFSVVRLCIYSFVLYAEPANLNEALLSDKTTCGFFG